MIEIYFLCQDYIFIDSVDLSFLMPSSFHQWLPLCVLCSGILFLYEPTRKALHEFPPPSSPLVYPTRQAPSIYPMLHIHSWLSCHSGHEQVIVVKDVLKCLQSCEILEVFDKQDHIVEPFDEAPIRLI